LSGSFTLDVFFSDTQGNFDFRFRDSITFRRPWNGKA